MQSVLPKKMSFTNFNNRTQYYFLPCMPVAISKCLYRCCLMQPFVAFSAFAGMTIPYPKREFLNDDDSDSKSSAAKVMEFYWIDHSNTQQGEIYAI